MEAVVNMKKLFALILSFLVCSFVFSELGIIDWNGRITDAESEPEWLVELENGREKPAREALNVDKKERLFLFVSEGKDYEMAKSDCEIKAKNKLISLKSVIKTDVVVKANGWEKAFEHWIQYSDEKGNEFYKVFMVYVY